MNKIPTAEEFLEMNVGREMKSVPKYIEKLMIEFARLHVEAAINTIYDNGLDDATEWSGNPYTGEGSDYLSLDKLKKSYPINNIK